MRLPRNLVGLLGEHIMGMKTDRDAILSLPQPRSQTHWLQVLGLQSESARITVKRPGPKPAAKPFGGAAKHLETSVRYNSLSAVYKTVVGFIGSTRGSSSGLSRVWNFLDRGMLCAVNDAIRLEIEKGDSLRKAAAPLDLRKMSKEDKAKARKAKADAELKAKAARAEERARKRKLKSDALAAKVAARTERRAHKARELEAKKARAEKRAVAREAHEKVRLKKVEERLKRKLEEQKKRDEKELEMKLMRQKMQEKQIKSAAEKRGGTRFYRGIEGENLLRADHLWNINARYPLVSSL